MEILITGFEPFGSDTCNPSSQVLSLLPETVGSCHIVTAVIPCVRFEAENRVTELIEKYHPDYVISLGLAGGRRGISLERTAVNVDDFRIADNKGNQPHDEPAVKDGPCAYFSALPLRKMEAAIKQAGFEASVSESAGTFVCNHLFYTVRWWCENNMPSVKSGFIHLPYSDEMNKEGAFSMTLAEMAAAVQAAVSVLFEGNA